MEKFVFGLREGIGIPPEIEFLLPSVFEKRPRIMISQLSVRDIQSVVRLVVLAVRLVNPKQYIYDLSLIIEEIKSVPAKSCCEDYYSDPH
ncbi:hypothetical protein Bca4012_056527 [Brassica carinata]|uniref:Uncharacterized protein n=1 Tax=Brassica carinata TaxID=52824 RepID=A0A8X7W0R4_BRACI|nr:hypothetical protein Bca52824_013648 [Brassica carinata]